MSPTRRWHNALQAAASLFTRAQDWDSLGRRALNEARCAPCVRLCGRSLRKDNSTALFSYHNLLSPLRFERVCSTLRMCACDVLFQAIFLLGIWKFEIVSTPPAPLNFDSLRDRLSSKRKAIVEWIFLTTRSPCVFLGSGKPRGALPHALGRSSMILR